MSVSRDEIKNWKNDGWTFRIKTVKGNKYITRRKGKQEKGLGRFDEKLWKLIQQNSVLSKHIKERTEAQNSITAIVEIDRILKMSLDCSHIVDDFCYFWKYAEQPSFFRIADNVSLSECYKKVDFGKSSFWVFIAAPFYCRNCSAYTRTPTNDYT
jgi:hypothetical protein